MQPTTKELEKRYNDMPDDKIISLLESEGMRQDAVHILEKIAKKRSLDFTRSQKTEEATHDQNKKEAFKPEEILKAKKTIRNLGIFLQIFGSLTVIINILVLQSIISAELLGILYGISIFMSGRIMYKNRYGDPYKYVKQLLITTLMMVILAEGKFDANMVITIWISGWYLNDRSWKCLKGLPREQINNLYLWCMGVFGVLYAVASIHQ